MEKTTYVKPEIKVMIMEDSSIMAASDNSISINVDNSGDDFDGTFRSKPHFNFLNNDNE